MSFAPEWKLVCVDCSAEYRAGRTSSRCDCGGTLDVVHAWSGLEPGKLKDTFDSRIGSMKPVDVSGVWRFRELVLPVQEHYIRTRPEGNTGLYSSHRLSGFTGIEALHLKHEGENPTGSFKDRGMTVAVTVAGLLDADAVACASTGNTAASMAAYAAFFGLKALVFVPAGKIALGKLAQTLAYGAKTIQVDADFDAAMELVEQVCRLRGIYLVNSLNPYRIEGQKAIGFELLQQLDWNVPDWVVLPGGNLGNNSALSKGFLELYELGILRKLPRMAVIQASGANPLYTAFKQGKDLVPLKRPETVASAIRIGQPVSWRKSLRGIRALDGLVEEVTDKEILQAKIEVDASGIGAEPASCASVAGAKKLVEKRIISKNDHVVCILTGNLLKDPDTVTAIHGGAFGLDLNGVNRPVKASPDIDAVLEAVDSLTEED